MKISSLTSAILLSFTLTLVSCFNNQVSKDDNASTLLAKPQVTHHDSMTNSKDKVMHGELISDITDAKKQLHSHHHPHNILETRRVPGYTDPSKMTDVSDFALSKDDLVVINPGPGEYVHVMEGRRHGYLNLTIGITYTAPGGAPPMHTHEGEESHVLLAKQKILYALGEKIFVKKGPYMVNIPPMVPHSFQNLDNEVAELVVIFPTNIWEYDVLDYFPFSTAEAKKLAAQAKEKDIKD